MKKNRKHNQKAKTERRARLPISMATRAVDSERKPRGRDCKGNGLFQNTVSSVGVMPSQATARVPLLPSR